MFKSKYLTANNVSPFDRVFGDIDKIFEDAFPRIATPFPPTNLERTQDGYIIEMALAGYKRENISVSQEGNILTIAADKQDDKSESSSKVIYRGIKASSFRKSFTLEKTAEVSDVTLTDGILTVKIRYDAPECKKLNFEIK